LYLVEIPDVVEMFGRCRLIKRDEDFTTIRSRFPQDVTSVDIKGLHLVLNVCVTCCPKEEIS
jgi:hypothetical protein